MAFSAAGLASSGFRVQPCGVCLAESVILAMVEEALSVWHVRALRMVSWSFGLRLRARLYSRKKLVSGVPVLGFVLAECAL